MSEVKNVSIPDVCQNKFHLISHIYFTNNSMYNFKEPRFSLETTKFATSSRGPYLWNKTLHNNEKQINKSSKTSFIFQTISKFI